ncbi:Crp/Fnr family transcriptional regulator [Halodesulfovibrio marinisediminis]|uniref:CRP/FNR family transcriptional regulator, anaerobic regulatory protein n=1 Tax=Halodesulfovibrio marinisediminis DSM 17456 TaxID=1121457 RepID=A0A1N6E5E4_9BACT|nr:Crp/Fnr family transcriptional regulator [Halodesulfovibrio marinisediminis]SIN78211.1 CRP/FNR family transcriptional regulator, anaerobic regulatory protein [Halodesulfovibrio marinisediminis DSM 17456]
METLEQALRKLPLFAEVPSEVFPILLTGAIEMTYQAKEIIIGEGESPSGLYILLDGTAKLYKSSPDGKEQTLFVLNSGEPFCLCSTFRKKPFPVTAAAPTTCRVVSITKQAFFTAAEKDNAFLFSILLKVSERLRDAMELAGTLSLQEVPQRIATFITKLESENDSSENQQNVRLPMSHKELAKVIGATPEALSRTLKRMSDKGMIAIEGRNVHILDRERLEQCAEMGL